MFKYIPSHQKANRDTFKSDESFCLTYQINNNQKSAGVPSVVQWVKNPIAATQAATEA